MRTCGLSGIPAAAAGPRLELRHNFTAGDAMYIALAEQLTMPLLTDDAKLAGSGHHADIRRYPADRRREMRAEWPRNVGAACYL
jgi:hypothetical protein